MTRLGIAALVLLSLQPAFAASTPYSIDVILPLTGPTAFAGKTQEQAARAYESVVNKAGGIHGQMLHFEVHDDQSNPSVDVQIVNEILAKHPVVVLGPSLTANCAAVVPLFVNGPVNFCFSPGIVPPHGGYVFASSASQQAVVYARYARVRAMGYRRLGVLVASDATGQQDAKFTLASLALPENRNLQLVAMETFNSTDISVAAQIAKIKAANPDFVYVSAIGTAFGTALREIANAGLNVPIATSTTNAGQQQLAQYKSFLPKVLITTGMPYQATLHDKSIKMAADEYLDALKEAGIPSDPTQAFAWDPIRITVTTLRRLPASANATQLRDSLKSVHDFAGLFGIYDFRSGDQHGLDGMDSPFLQWDAARNTWLEVTPGSQAAG